MHKPCKLTINQVSKVFFINKILGYSINRV